MSEYNLDLKRASVGGRVFSHIQVTEENMGEIAKWTRGLYKKRDLHYVVEVPRKNGNGVMFAWPGCYILKYLDTNEFEVRSPRNISI